MASPGDFAEVVLKLWLTMSILATVAKVKEAFPIPLQKQAGSSLEF